LAKEASKFTRKSADKGGYFRLGKLEPSLGEVLPGGGGDIELDRDLSMTAEPRTESAIKAGLKPDYFSGDRN
jgi:hypothetical protein